MHIEMKHIEKIFGENQVLFDAGIDIVPGEVHALMGENGAGKSTLMNILTGVHEKNGGTIKINGEEKTYAGPKEAENNGISFIHQELNVLPDMTIEENLFLNKEIRKAFGLVDQKEMRKQATEVLSRVGLTQDPNTVLSSLSVGTQQLIEICKALMTNAEVIIMDEPTAALSDTESARLFEIIETLKKEDVSIIYISHRMEEIFKISDRITVMRDGRYIETLKTKETTNAELVRLMIGRELTEQFPERVPEIGDVRLEVKNVSDEDLLEDVSFSVRAGEILGVSGLMGAGRSELMYAIFGDRKTTTGELWIDGEKASISNPKEAMNHGIALVTEDRKSEGLLLDKSIRENITLANFDELSNRGFINEKMEKEVAESSSKMFNIRTESIETNTGNLSGGNQQKAFIAKWILTNPKVLILDEPTRGVDVGSKAEIYDIMNDLTKQGISIIMVSSDLPEIIGMSDRVAVMHEGKLQGIIDREKASQENIMTLATGGEINEYSKNI